MRNPFIAFMLVAGTAMAGTSSKEVIPPPSTPEPSLWRWFAGASGGYLLDTEEAMYHLHVGVDMPYDWAGWKPSLFLEVGIAETDDITSIVDPTIPTAVVTTPLISDFQFVPLTLNFKLERQLVSGLHFYAGLGAGVAFTQFDGYANFATGPDFSISEDDTVFYAQIFAGLGYDITDHFEVYAGARWIYMDSPEVAGLTTGVAGFDDDDVLVEGGLRITF